MPRQKALNLRQQRFCKLFTQGETAGNISQSHRKAGYVCPTIEGHASNGCRLLKSERIKKEISRLREKAFSSDVLTFNEKRNYLARVVRSDATAPDADLVQEVREEVDAEGNVKRVRKMVSKLEALNIDNKMIGHEHKDREVQASNPFMFLISLSKPGASLAQGDVALLPAIPPASVPAPVIIDAELVE
jgi:hypothetical protein